MGSDAVNRQTKETGQRGMDMDEEATPALSGLVSLDELPPVDAEMFDKHFALLDERDHGRGPKGSQRSDKKRPMALEEARPDKPTRAGRSKDPATEDRA